MRILIADDDLMLAATLADMVEKCGHEVSGFARTGVGAIRAYGEQRPEVVLMDFSMTGINGANASRMILSQHPRAKIVILSGFLSKEDLSLVECGAVIMEPKPIDTGRLREILDDLDLAAHGFNPS
jgi:DNA-binding NarL/FixJ family response regulator